MFALATLFLSPERQHKDVTSVNASELDVLQHYGSCGLGWAKSAVREATPSAIEQPSLVTTQALECLQLYWFGIGNLQSCSLCLSLAYRSCHLLGYNRRIIDGCNDSDLSLESEFNRRCLWACWISTCIGMEPESCIRAAWKEVAMVPLPAYIQDCGSHYDIILTEKMNQNWESRPLELNKRHHATTPAAAFLVKIMGVWAKVQLLVKDWNASSPSLNIKSVYSLSDLATSICNSANTVNDPITVNDTEFASHSMKLLAESLFHQCQIILHSMLVPLFSGASTGPEIDLESVKRSAESVIRHAGLHEKLLNPFLYGNGDITVLPPLMGYGAFITGIVLLATETSCQDKRLQESITERRTEGRKLRAVRAISRLLNALCRHWRPLGHLSEQLSSALDRQLLPFASQESSTERNRMYRIDRMQACNEATPLGLSAQESDGPPTLAPHLGTMNHSIYQANNPRADSRSSLALTQNCSGVGEADSVDPEDLLMEQRDVSLDDTWYNLSIGDVCLEEHSGFEPLALFQQGWRVLN
ncbi:hypothetical protein BDV36DRAFT_28610 [Aspergillus pseudocaelatus]|uniref:Xylanolytic transcriptional activator regulatory domain-containing protein n=1 Tax=Aspergillus pseudocaelatus TaxID=1825620 RepID=A0ABQ6WDH2_9EURO|nr:hypothetical protein BDV36DRAFT_28610 [Aspergillus pseudocaelatus]